jgi:hypothetical protein
MMVNADQPFIFLGCQVKLVYITALENNGPNSLDLALIEPEFVFVPIDEKPNVFQRINHLLNYFERIFYSKMRSIQFEVLPKPKRPYFPMIKLAERKVNAFFIPLNKIICPKKPLRDA